MKIGIIGLGTVGEGVLKVLTNEKESIFEKSRADIEVKYACDLNINRDFSFDFDKSILTNDYKKIIKFVDLILEKKPELIKEELISLLTEYEEYDQNKKDVNER